MGAATKKKMEALRASYGGSSDSDPDDSPFPLAQEAEKAITLPPPPLSLLSPPDSFEGNTPCPSPFPPYSYWMALLFHQPSCQVSDVLLVKGCSTVGPMDSPVGSEASPTLKAITLFTCTFPVGVVLLVNGFC